MDWSYMRFLDYYQYHWSPIEGDPLSRYNLVISVSIASYFTESRPVDIGTMFFSPYMLPHP